MQPHSRISFFNFIIPFLVAMVIIVLQGCADIGIPPGLVEDRK